MSSEALAWAFKLPIRPSSVKFTLVALCECANYQTGKIFPSIEHICQITGQDRKTVISNISKLLELGYITETGERVGSTGQIKVYQANIGTVPEKEQYRKRNSSVSPDKSTVSPDKSTVFPVKEYQKRDTEPSREPLSKPSRIIKGVELPDWLPIDAWNGWITMRKKMKKPPTDRAIQMAIRKLEELARQGESTEAVLDQSTLAGWTDLYPVKKDGKQNGKRTHNGKSTDGLSSTARAALSVFGDEDCFDEPHACKQDGVSQSVNRLPSPHGSQWDDGGSSVGLAARGVDDTEPFAF